MSALAESAPAAQPADAGAAETQRRTTAWHSGRLNDGHLSRTHNGTTIINPPGLLMAAREPIESTPERDWITKHLQPPVIDISTEAFEQAVAWEQATVTAEVEGVSYQLWPYDPSLDPAYEDEDGVMAVVNLAERRARKQRQPEPALAPVVPLRRAA